MARKPKKKDPLNDPLPAEWANGEGGIPEPVASDLPPFPEVHEAVKAMVRSNISDLFAADQSDEVLQRVAKLIDAIVSGIDAGMRDGQTGQTGPLSTFALVYALEGQAVGWENAVTCVAATENPSLVAASAIRRILTSAIHEAQIRLAISARSCTQIISADYMTKMDAQANTGEVGNA